MTSIRMYFAPWCRDCRAAKRFLDERELRYEAVNIEENGDAADLIRQRNGGSRKVPTFEVNGRWFALSPFDPESLAEQLELASA